MNLKRTLNSRPVLEALEERCLLESRVNVMHLSGPGDTNVMLPQQQMVSMITIGGAITAAMLFGPPGSPGSGPGAPGGDAPMSPEAQAESANLNMVQAIPLPQAVELAPPVPEEVIEVMVRNLTPA